MKDRYKILEHKELFDSHCHLGREEFDIDRQQVIESMLKVGVSKVVDVATDIKSAKDSLLLSKDYPDVVYPTIGVHPDMFIPESAEGPNKPFFSSTWGKAQDELFEELERELTANEGYVMIGECGLDFYWLEKMNINQEKFNSSKDLQIEAFERQVILAEKYDLPMTIHARDAHDDCINILKKYSGSLEAVMHSFTGNYTQLIEIIDLGYKVGLNGIVTFKSAKILQEAVKQYLSGTRIESARDLYKKNIYMETDAPFLAPGRYRGNRNEPAYVSEILSFTKRLSL